MSAPPVMRPLRAILQRRLQIVPSRPIRTHFYGRAIQTSPQLRFNSSIPPDQPPKPDEKATKDDAPKSEAITTEPQVQEARHDANATLTDTTKIKKVSETQVKTEAGTPAAPEAEAITPTITSENAAPTQPPVRRLDEVFLRSVFQQVKAVDAEVQAGIDAIVARQLEAAASPAEPPVPELDPAVQEVEEPSQEAQEAQETAAIHSSVEEDIPVETAPLTLLKEEVVASDNAMETETPEPSLAEVAEAVFLESDANATSQLSEQETPAPAAATAQAASSETQTETAEPAPLKTGSPEVTEEVLLDSSGPQVTASDVYSPAASISNIESESVEPQEQEVKSEKVAEASMSDTTVSESSAQAESPAQDPVMKPTVEKMLDDLAAEAAAARSIGDNSLYSQDAFMQAVLNEGTKASEPQNESRKDSLSSAVDSELLRREGEVLQAAEQAEEETAELPQARRLPRNVQALYLLPFRHVAEYGVPSCDLQLRSFSVRPLESFCDFALRAAYYLGLPAYGPVPLPKVIERWTVPRSSFIFKKSQENFERITRRRLIQIRDGHPETVQMWLAYLQKHQQAAVGMKANIWEFSSLDVAKEMDKAYEQAQESLNKSYEFLGQTRSIETAEKVDEILQSERYRIAGGR